jgi:hypothetical protein
MAVVNFRYGNNVGFESFILQPLGAETGSCLSLVEKRIISLTPGHPVTGFVEPEVTLAVVWRDFRESVVHA